MLIATNQLFCYWLQGYFEIGLDVQLRQREVLLIKKQLDSINEPLGDFTSWLHSVCVYLAKVDYDEAFCLHFSPIIKRSLNSVFLHVIDDSYTTKKSKEELQRIHDGDSHDK